MDATVVRCDEHTIELSAPLAPNVNHHGTMFGGSLSALALLTGWSAVYRALAPAGIDAHIVIRQNTMDYVAPAAGPVLARCEPLEPVVAERLLRTVRRLGRARVSLSVALYCRDALVARFSGDYAAAIR